MKEFPDNELEMALIRAADDPSSRPEFYKKLLESQVFILGKTDDTGASGTIPAGANLSIVNWQRQDGSPAIPFFSSLSALQRAIEAEQTYLALPARSLFEVAKGAHFFLNPNLPYGKEFFPNEISALLTSGSNQLPDQRVVEKETQVLLGQPKNYPSEMVSALTLLLAKYSNIKAAYLALMHQPNANPPESLVVGLEGESNLKDVIAAVGSVASDTKPKNIPVDVVTVNPGEKGLSEYLLKYTQPFYERSWGVKLKSVFGFGRA